MEIFIDYIWEENGSLYLFLGLGVGFFWGREFRLEVLENSCFIFEKRYFFYDFRILSEVSYF